MSLKERWRREDSTKGKRFEYVTPCATCVHLTGWGVCEAFPNGIPAEIYDGQEKHLTPYPGDKGIVYKQATDGD